MADSKSNTAFVVKPVASSSGPGEFRQSMAPHPLVHQELPHDPHFGIYNRRLQSLEYGNVSTEDLYWRLPRQVGLAPTGEVTTEIRGHGMTLRAATNQIGSAAPDGFRRVLVRAIIGAGLVLNCGALLLLALAVWRPGHVLSVGSLLRTAHPDGIECMACGMCRALCAIGQGEFTKAVDLNSGSLLLVGTTILTTLLFLWLAFRRAWSASPGISSI